MPRADALVPTALRGRRRSARRRTGCATQGTFGHGLMGSRRDTPGGRVQGNNPKNGRRLAEHSSARGERRPIGHPSVARHTDADGSCRPAMHPVRTPAAAAAGVCTVCIVLKVCAHVPAHRQRVVRLSYGRLPSGLRLPTGAAAALTPPHPPRPTGDTRASAAGGLAPCPGGVACGPRGGRGAAGRLAGRTRRRCRHRPCGDERPRPLFVNRRWATKKQKKEGHKPSGATAGGD